MGKCFTHEATAVRRWSFTLVEVMIVLVIIAILVSMGATIAFNSWERQIELNAKVYLGVLQRAVYDYYVRTKACSSNYEILGIADPNRKDEYYNYTIICGSPIEIRAQRKTDPSKCFCVGLFGEIQNCP